MTRCVRTTLVSAITMAMFGCQAHAVSNLAPIAASESTVHVSAHGSVKAPATDTLPGTLPLQPLAGSIGMTAANSGSFPGSQAGSALTASAMKLTIDPANAAAPIPVNPTEVQARQLMLGYKADALAKAQPTAISAAAGGVLQSADGKLTATVPPGALSRDAQIKITPMDPSLLAGNPLYNPGIMFAADLGGATLAPGTAITVTMPVAPDFVARTQAMDPSFTPDAYHLSQDASGQWTMAMQIKGPVLGAGPTAPAVDNANMLEWGALPAATAAVPQRQLQDVEVTAAASAASVPAAGDCSIPLWLVIRNEALGVWGCGSVDHHAICFAELTPPPPSQLAFSALWYSDDPAFDGHVISGLPIHVDYTLDPSLLIGTTEGAPDLATDGTGHASTFALYGSAVAVSATSPLGGTQTGSALIESNTTFAFTAPHMMPVITLHVGGGDGKIPATLLVHYTLDGVDHTDAVPTGAAAGSTTGNVTWKVPVPGEAAYTLTLVDAGSADRSVIKLPAPLESHGIQANGGAAYAIALISAEPK